MSVVCSHLPGLSPSTSQGNPGSLPATIVNGSNRGVFGDSYSTQSSYQMPQRPILSPPHVGPPDYTRFAPTFSTSPQHPENSVSSLSSPGTVYSNPQNMSYDQSARSSSASEEKTPPFEKTQLLYRVTNARNQPVDIEITAKISKGFFKVDQKWTCYRRNYFSVSCAFSLNPPDLPSDIPLYISRPNQTPEAIHKFYVAISAKTAVSSSEQESETRELVQHTPKRDKASETTPVPMPVRPAQTAQSAVGGMGNRAYSGMTQYPASMMNDYTNTSYAATSQSTPMSHTFERIQFVKATANNGKRRAQQQYYHIVVDLLAEVGNNREKIKIATVQSDQMVVRGRSPGHYKDNERKGSFTNGDPDRGPSSGHEAGGGSAAMPPSMPHRHMSSSMDWESGHGRGSHMGGRNYTHFSKTGCITLHNDLSVSSAQSRESDTTGRRDHLEPAASMVSDTERSHAIVLDDVMPSSAETVSEAGVVSCDIGGDQVQPAPFMEVNQNWQPILPSFPGSWSGHSHQRRLPALENSFGGPAESLSTSHDEAQLGSNPPFSISELRLPGVLQNRDVPVTENYITAF